MPENQLGDSLSVYKIENVDGVRGFNYPFLSLTLCDTKGTHCPVILS